MRARTIAVMLGTVCGVLPVAATSARAAVVNDYPVPKSSSYDESVTSVTVAPDGRVWFLVNPAQVGVLDPAAAMSGTSDGLTTESIPTATGSNSNPQSIVAAPDGTIFYSDEAGGSTHGISKVDPATKAITGLTSSIGPRTLVFSTAIGSLFGTDSGDDSVDKLVLGPPVSVQHSAVVKSPYAWGIAADAANHVWVTEDGRNSSGQPPAIGELNAADAIIGEFPVPTGGSQPIADTVDHDGNVWFAEHRANQIGELVPSETQNGTSAGIREFPIPNEAGGEPIDITTAPDGSIWFAEQAGVSSGTNAVGSFTPPAAGGSSIAITLQGLPNSAAPFSVRADPAGNLWVGAADPFNVNSGTAEVDEIVAAAGSGGTGGTGTTGDTGATGTGGTTGATTTAAAPPPAPPPATTPPPTTTVVQAVTPGTVKTFQPVVSGTTVSQAVECVSRLPNGRCDVILLLATNELVQVGGFVASVHGAAAHPAKPVTYGSAHASLVAGAKRTLKVKLNAKGKRALGRAGHLKLTLLVAETINGRHQVVKRTTVTLRRHH